MSAVIRLQHATELIDSDRSLREKYTEVPNKRIVRDNDIVYTGIQEIPTTAGGTAIEIGAITSTWIAEFMNLDSENYVQIGFDVTGTFHPFAKLEGGMQIPNRIELDPSKTYKALADTSPVKLKVVVFQRNS